VQPGDRIIISGDIGRHGIAIMAEREGIDFETTIESDSAALAAPVMALIDAGIEIHCMRDLTRGGLASTLVEIAQTAKVQIDIDEKAIPVEKQVQAACEILGFDPMYVANEGRFTAIVAPHHESRTVEILKEFQDSRNACCIGEVNSTQRPLVSMKSRIGANRIIDMLSGEQLPRIC
jgi:hydrogenase expression/formation protein HypE